eukprot:TRINITY_DN12138_c0_g1_i1.p1 TRINITY_DN12138_c0_g1~~TRINITY_DN12138_c0_g1_i1.p1  ORF type:complete len:212 (+),score=37.27 TRINITY_DN12138_c0_g1_i1:385-1020(+)
MSHDIDGNNIDIENQQSKPFQYKTDCISLTDKNLEKFFGKKPPQFRCDNHPDPDSKHIYSIAGIYMHDQQFRRKYDRPEDFTKKTYSILKTQQGQYITHKQLRKIYQKQLTSFLKGILEIAAIDQELDYLKTELSLRPDFRIKSIFKLFDKKKKGFLDQEDIVSLFNELNIKYTNQQIEIFLRKYLQTKEENQKICPYKHFIKQVLSLIHI